MQAYPPPRHTHTHTPTRARTHTHTRARTHARTSLHIRASCTGVGCSLCSTDGTGCTGLGLGIVCAVTRVRAARRILQAPSGMRHGCPCPRARLRLVPCARTTLCVESCRRCRLVELLVLHATFRCATPAQASHTQQRLLNGRQCGALDDSGPHLHEAVHAASPHAASPAQCTQRPVQTFLESNSKIRAQPLTAHDASLCVRACVGVRAGGRLYLCGCVQSVTNHCWAMVPLTLVVNAGHRMVTPAKLGACKLRTSTSGRPRSSQTLSPTFAETRTEAPRSGQDSIFRG
jgi:hypothetical protein